MLYRFCFLDPQGRIATSEEIEVNSLIDAIARAHMLLIQSPHHAAVEVWLDNKCAYSARRDQAAAYAVMCDAPVEFRAATDTTSDGRFSSD